MASIFGIYIFWEIIYLLKIDFSFFLKKNLKKPKWRNSSCYTLFQVGHWEFTRVATTTKIAVRARVDLTWTESGRVHQTKLKQSTRGFFISLEASNWLHTTFSSDAEEVAQKSRLNPWDHIIIFQPLKVNNSINYSPILI